MIDLEWLERHIAPRQPKDGRDVEDTIEDLRKLLVRISESTSRPDHIDEDDPDFTPDPPAPH